MVTGNEVEEAPQVKDTSSSIDDYGIEIVNAMTEKQLEFIDHFSLISPSSKIRYRITNIDQEAKMVESHCINIGNSQYLLERISSEGEKEQLTIKRASEASEHLTALRAFYSLVSLFWSGFLAVFGTMVLLFLILDFTVYTGETSLDGFNASALFGTILTVPLFIVGFAEALAIAGYFVSDTFYGHRLMRSFLFQEDRQRWKSNVVSEWISFVLFLGIPFLVMAVSLLSRDDDWWKKTSLTWFTCMGITYGVFALSVIKYEIGVCFRIISREYETDEKGIVQARMDENRSSFFAKVKKLIILRNVNRWSGTQKETRFETSDMKVYRKSFANRNEKAFCYKFSWTYITKYLAKHGIFFELIEENQGKGKRLYSYVESLEKKDFITRHNWGLENIFCRPKDVSFAAVIAGSDRILRSQARSSFAYAIVLTLLVLCIFVGFMAWLVGDYIAYVWFIIPMYIIATVPYVSSIIGQFQLLSELDRNREQAKQEGNESITLSEVQECHRVTQLSETGAMVAFLFEVVLLYIYPIANSFSLDNKGVGWLFLVVGLAVGIRHYFDPSIVLEEYGNLREIFSSIRKDEKRAWQSESRINEIVSKITRSGSKRAWVTIYTFLILAMFALSGLSIAGDAKEGDLDNAFYERDLFYMNEDNLPYPTCEFGKNLGSGGQPTNLLVDYAFMASAAYRDISVTQESLDAWFYNSTVIPKDDKTTVSTFRESNDIAKQSSVQFKLFTFDEGDDNLFAVVAVRGTTNAWDALSDMQLWGTAALFQFIRLILPFGELWTPILNSLVEIIAKLQSASINDVAYYRTVVEFVEFLKESKNYTSIQITGHSLGGGLSMIVGAKTKLPAIALSGPNTMISRRVFGDITEDDLNKYTFNIIPDRDVVPMLDDPARLNQKIRCTAKLNESAGCHSSTRSLCELLYTCGSGSRPIPTSCFCELGYPIPNSYSGSDFNEEDCVCKYNHDITELPSGRSFDKSNCSF